MTSPKPSQSGASDLDDLFPKSASQPILSNSLFPPVNQSLVAPAPQQQALFDDIFGSNNFDFQPANQNQAWTSNTSLSSNQNQAWPSSNNLAANQSQAWSSSSNGSLANQNQAWPLNSGLSTNQNQAWPANSSLSTNQNQLWPSSSDLLTTQNQAKSSSQGLADLSWPSMSVPPANQMSAALPLAGPAMPYAPVPANSQVNWDKPSSNTQSTNVMDNAFGDLISSFGLTSTNQQSTPKSFGVSCFPIDSHPHLASSHWLPAALCVQ